MAVSLLNAEIAARLKQNNFRKLDPRGTERKEGILRDAEESLQPRVTISGAT
jgi:hypothetical protein